MINILILSVILRNNTWKWKPSYVVLVRSQLNKNGKEAWEDIEYFFIVVKRWFYKFITYWNNWLCDVIDWSQKSTNSNILYYNYLTDSLELFKLLIIPWIILCTILILWMIIWTAIEPKNHIGGLLTSISHITRLDPSH